MDAALVVRLLIVLVVANAAPILAHRALRERLALPVDLGATLPDATPLLGRDKTWRGVLASIAASAAAAWALGWPPATGAMLGAASMAGDLSSSFVKRRLRLAPGHSAPVLDQLPESLLPLLVLRDRVGAGPSEVVVACLLFLALHPLASRLAYRLGVRRRPR